MKELHNILFDLDGTLVDSSRAIRASLSYALERLGSGMPPDRGVETFIGLPLLEILADTFGITGQRAELGIRHYREHYDEHAQSESRVYDHVEELLERLDRAGFRLFVATVKPAPIAEKVLRDMRLRPWFSGVAGSSMDHSRRDKSAIIRHALEQFGLAAEHSLMIGDRGADISGARHNGLRAVAVSYGFGSLEELLAAGPDHIVGCSSEIAPLLVPTGGNGF
jgi:phosphoglycolate phosphatase